MKVNLPLDLSVILRRYCFFETQEAEDDVINEIIELIKKRDNEVIGEDEIVLPLPYEMVLRKGTPDPTEWARNNLRIEQRKKAEETL